MKTSTGLLLLIAAGLASVTAVAAPASKCIPKILADHPKWPASVSENVLCARTNSNFFEAVRILCNPSQSDVSAEYQAYRVNEIKYNDELAKPITSDADRAILSMNLQMIENDWIIIGYRNEIDEALAVFEFTRCDGK